MAWHTLAVSVIAMGMLRDQVNYGVITEYGALNNY